jgi:hypothetical protein
VNEREARIGRNEALFREVNERIEAIHEALGRDVETAEFVCECGRASCAEHITMPLVQYESVRADPTTFAVITGHDEPDVEVVVERRGAYDVVRKLPGEPSELAARESPR